MGTQQSGLLNLKIADLVKDNQVLNTARYYANEVLKKDPELLSEQHAVIRNTYSEIATTTTTIIRIRSSAVPFLRKEFLKQ